MKRFLGLILTYFLLIYTNGFCASTCSRIAIINYQEVLVDTNSTQKGEGLRYYLEKDPIARMYLERYQKGTEIKWQNAIIGSMGTALILAGLVTNMPNDNKRSFLIGGASLIAINFLVAKTIEHNNEKNLLKAIERYNKHNLPHIYFNPFSGSGRNPSSSNSALTPSILINKVWSF